MCARNGERLSLKCGRNSLNIQHNSTDLANQKQSRGYIPCSTQAVYPSFLALQNSQLFAAKQKVKTRDGMQINSLLYFDNISPHCYRSTKLVSTTTLSFS